MRKTIKRIKGLIVCAGMLLGLSPLFLTEVKAADGFMMTPDRKDFGTVYKGYAVPPEAQEFRFDNYSESLVDVQLDFIDNTNAFDLSNGNCASVGENDHCSFTVRPKAGLSTGTYTATYMVNKGRQSETLATATVSFTVKEHELTIDKTAGFSYTDDTLTITAAGNYTIGMTTPGAVTSDHIVVQPDPAGVVNLTLNGVSIDNSSLDGSNTKPALQIISTATTTITVAEGTVNTLKAGRLHAGLESSSSPIVISGTGSLIADGGRAAAGIGGGNNQVGKNITIESGTVTATGGYSGAGIGGGEKSAGSDITINGGIVEATGGYGGAGIGGSNSYSGSKIRINGGTVTATSGTNGAGIGGGATSDGTDIKIYGGNVIATGDNGAGIGGGVTGDGTDITIYDGTVTATSEDDGAGIGGGGGSGGSASQITILGGTVTATSKDKGAGIGAGYNGDSSGLYFMGGTIYAMGNQMDLPNTYNGALGGATPDFATNWYQWRTSTEVVKPTGEYSTEAYVGSRDHLGVEFTPINTPTESQESAPGPFLVTFLDCKGETVKVEWVAYQGNATAPSSDYSGYTDVSAHMDIKPNSCKVSYTVPNTADK